MKIKILLLSFFSVNSLFAQINQDHIGAWYMYLFNSTFKESSWGVQGDVQYRNWNLGGDLEQLLLRGGITYQPHNATIKFTTGYGNITSGKYGDDNTTSGEHRIYQEMLFPSKIGNRFHFNHRVRFEQRFVDNQNFRTRYRYNLFLNVPLNNSDLIANTLYLAMYDEIFLNGQRDIGNGNTVEIFDRNRIYLAMGYVYNQQLKLQLGMMNQATDPWQKNQVQFSLHHSF